MRKLRKIFQLHFEIGLSARAIARSCKLSPGTVLGYLDRAKVAQLKWPQVASLDDAALNALPFPDENRPVRGRAEPDGAQSQEPLTSTGSLTAKVTSWRF